MRFAFSSRPIAGLAVLTALCAMAHADNFTIQGVNYSSTGSTESLTAFYNNQFGQPSTGGYYGFVKLIVSGTGNSLGGDLNDAFWFVPSGGDPGGNYQLTFHTPAQGPADPQYNAVSFIYFDIDANLEVTTRPYRPSYRSADHTYSFIVATGFSQASPGTLYFSVNDGNFGDNNGQYNVQITQLSGATAVPEPTSFQLIPVAGAMALAMFRRRKR